MSDPPRIDPRILHGCDLSTPQGRQAAGMARMIVDAVVPWPHCPRRACRRARRCFDPHARCFFLRHEALREGVYPMLRDIAARRAARAAQGEAEDRPRVRRNFASPLRHSLDAGQACVAPRRQAARPPPREDVFP